MRHFNLALAAILFSMISFVRAQDALQPLPAADLVQLAQKYIRPQTVGFFHIDIARVDLKTLHDWYNTSLSGSQLSPDDTKLAIDGANDMVTTADTWITAFRKAGGRQILYLISDQGGRIAIAPMETGADPHTLQALMFSGKADGPVDADAAQFKNNPQMARFIMHSKVVDNAVVIGNLEMINALANPRPAARPEVAAALETIGDAPLSIAVIPTDAFRRQIESSTGKKLPPFLGGAPVSTLTQGIQWISLAAQFPPDEAITANIQCADAATAKGVNDIMTSALKFALILPKMPNQPNWGLLTAGITPQLNDSRITLALDSTIVDRIVPAAAQGLIFARRQALSVQSMSNMRQLTMACLMYTNDHKGDWPEKLDDIAAKYLNTAMLQNPARPDLKPGYIYLKPGNTAGIHNPSQTMVIYEANDAKSTLVNVAFADGHVERENKPVFDKMLLQTQTAGGENGL